MNYQSLLNAASAAGEAAYKAASPEPMIVSGHGEQYYVPEGPCGFAWVKFAGNTAFGKYCKKAGIARSAYPKGLMIRDSHPSQSYDRKYAWASAFAKVLRDNGIDAYADGRLD